MKDKILSNAAREQARQLAGLRARALELRGTLRVATALVEGGRAIDLAGLEEQIGRLCAAALDVAPDCGRRLRADLVALRGDTAVLTQILTAAKRP